MRREKTAGNIKAAYFIVALSADACHAIDAIKVCFLPAVCSYDQMQHSIDPVYLSG